MEKVTCNNLWPELSWIIKKYIPIEEENEIIVGNYELLLQKTDFEKTKIKFNKKLSVEIRFGHLNSQSALPQRSTIQISLPRYLSVIKLIQSLSIRLLNNSLLVWISLTLSCLSPSRHWILVLVFEFREMDLDSARGFCCFSCGYNLYIICFLTWICCNLWIFRFSLNWLYGFDSQFVIAVVCGNNESFCFRSLTSSSSSSPPPSPANFDLTSKEFLWSKSSVAIEFEVKWNRYHGNG